MHNPRLLLLDEPTVGVDPQSRNHIFEGVRALNKQGLTILYTSHYMEEVEALCDRVGIMDGGKLVACDTVPNLIAGQGGAVIEIGVGNVLVTEEQTAVNSVACEYAEERRVSFQASCPQRRRLRIPSLPTTSSVSRRDNSTRTLPELIAALYEVEDFTALSQYPPAEPGDRLPRPDRQIAPRD